MAFVTWKPPPAGDPADPTHRLASEGLSRHDAVHAIASVFSGLWWELSTGRLDRNVDFNARYYAELEELTARSWLESAEDE